jgi:hypothetical protein
MNDCPSPRKIPDLAPLKSPTVRTLPRTALCATRSSVDRCDAPNKESHVEYSQNHLTNGLRYQIRIRRRVGNIGGPRLVGCGIDVRAEAVTDLRQGSQSRASSWSRASGRVRLCSTTWRSRPPASILRCGRSWGLEPFLSRELGFAHLRASSRFACLRARQDITFTNTANRGMLRMRGERSSATGKIRVAVPAFG